MKKMAEAIGVVFMGLFVVAVGVPVLWIGMTLIYHFLIQPFWINYIWRGLIK